MTASKRRWFDDAAGPVVRPYAVSRGRTRSYGETLDLLAVVVGRAPARADRRWLDPEHLRLLGLCRRPMTVADLAADVGLPLGVVRVLLGDLRYWGLISVRPPDTRSYAHDERILRTVLNELYTL
ncbi:DUF742 domain-containing protein [Actinoallomurus sp. NPDC052274]|uniref:DUF742 domain-containing protein n=1 Tax=Actinoallomurus sp. NPDC052274 TaxID=3155420 RepID=UPI00342BB847